MKNTTGAKVCAILDSNSTTEGFWMLEEGGLIHGQIVASFCLFYMVIGLPWNCLVIVTILKERLFRQPTILIFLNLVLMDIFILVFYMPHLIASGISGGYLVGENDHIRCSICWLSLLSVSLLMNSLFTVALISVDRLLFIIKPMRYDKIVTIPRTLVAIGVISIISTFLSLISLTRFEDVVYRPKYLSCTLDPESTTWFELLLIGSVCVALVVIMVCNVWVICIVWKNIRTVYKSQETISNDGKTSQNKSSEDKMKKKRHKKQLHLFRVFGALILSNMVSWIPYMITFVIENRTELPRTVFTVTTILFFAQVVVHPILETSLISDVRKPVKKMVTCGLSERKTCSKYPEECKYEDKKHGFRFWLKLLNTAVLHECSIASKSSFKHSGQEATSDTGKETTPSDDIKTSSAV